MAWFEIIGGLTAAAALATACLSLLGWLRRRRATEAPEEAFWSHLKRLRRESLARCENLWLSEGLEPSLARKWSEDQRIGYWQDLARAASADGLCVITDEAGAGKSLATERILQKKIEELEGARTDVLPVFRRAQEIRQSIAQECLDARNDVSALAPASFFLVLDGLDQVETPTALNLIGQARLLVASYPGTTVIATSRPVPAAREIPKLVVPRLSREQTLYITSAICDYPMTWADLLGVPDHIWTAMQLPRIAVRLGMWLDKEYLLPSSSAKLIAYVARAIISIRGTPNKPELSRLRALACAMLHRGSQAVPSTAVAVGRELEDLLETGLVSEVDDKLGFPYVCLRDWLAAQALACKEVKPESMLSTLESATRWSSAVSILATSAQFELVSCYLRPLSERYPGVASEVVYNAMAAHAVPDAPVSDSLEALGARLLAALLPWMTALGKVHRLILPPIEGEAHPPLGLRLERNHPVCSMAWYIGGKDMPAVFELSSEQEDVLNDTSLAYPLRLRVVPEDASTWRIAQQFISCRLKQILASYSMEVCDSPIVEEAIWYAACERTGVGPLSIESLPIRDVRPFPLSETGLSLGCPFAPWLTRGDLNQVVGSALERGDAVLYPPTPPPDFPKGSDSKQLCGWFSQQRLVEFLRKLLPLAIRAYLAWVDAWFSNLRGELATAILCPAEVEGLFLYEPETEKQFGFEGLWYLKPSKGETVVAGDIRVVDDMSVCDVRRLREAAADGRRLLPAYLRDRCRYEEGLFFFTGFDHPVSRLAGHLLYSDLLELKLVHGGTSPELSDGLILLTGREGFDLQR